MDDTIKRSDAIKAVSEPFDRKYWQYTTRSIRDTVKALNSIPSAEKQGEWRDKGWHGDWQFETDERGNVWHEYECSECGFRNKGSKSNYCPNCGARMKGADDE